MHLADFPKIRNQSLGTPDDTKLYVFTELIGIPFVAVIPIIMGELSVQKNALQHGAPIPAYLSPLIRIAWGPHN
jgi:hypothetical protein